MRLEIGKMINSDHLDLLVLTWMTWSLVMVHSNVSYPDVRDTGTLYTAHPQERAQSAVASTCAISRKLAELVLSLLVLDIGRKAKALCLDSTDKVENHTSAAWIYTYSTYIFTLV